MKPRLLRELTLYRFRYVLGYGAFVMLLALMVFSYIGSVPSGLSDAELASATKSMNLNPQAITALNVVDVPYHLLQKLSISLLGLTPFAIKLPSALVALATGMCIVFMLRTWFRDNVAVISSLLAVTSMPFLSAARSGTSLIMTFFWTSLLLLAATNALHVKRLRTLWKTVGLFAGLALLYSPFGIYPLIALLISGMLHPHVRHLFRKTSKKAYAAFIVLALIYLSPLVYAAATHPSILATLAGIQLESVTFDKIFDNARQLYGLFINPFGSTIKNGYITPLFGAATLAIMVFGLFKTIQDHHSARSYMLLIWLGFLLPLILLNPTMPFVVFIPATLLLAIGVESLIREWYDIFPLNPYARIGALIPLAILLTSIVATNMFRYFYGHIYTTDFYHRHNELAAIRHTLDRKDVNKAEQYLVANDNQPFYDLLRRDYPKLHVVSSAPSAVRGTVITLDGATVKGQTPYRIITDGKKDESHVLTVYTKW